MIENSSIKVIFFDETDDVELLSAPFYVEEGGVSISHPERTDDISVGLNYSPLFANGVSYGPRTVKIKAAITDLDHADVAILYRYLERLNVLSRYVSHPLMALHVKLGEDTSPYGGYLKVLAANLTPSDELFTIGRVYSIGTLGQPIELEFICDPFFYGNNFLDNDYEAVTMKYSTGAAWNATTNCSINHSDSFKPMFRVVSDTIKGDVPAPAIVKITNVTTDAGDRRLNDIFLTSRPLINYPALGASGTVVASSSWTDDLVVGFSPALSHGDDIDYRLSGKVMAFLDYTGIANDAKVEVSIKYQGITYADGITYYIKSPGTGWGFLPLGTMMVPYPGREPVNSYSISISAVDADGVSISSAAFRVYLVPAWSIRGYLQNGYGLAKTEVLLDNPYENTVFVESADGFDGSWYATIGEPFYVIPGIDQICSLMAVNDDGSAEPYDYRVQLNLYYNPRYLYLRKAVTN